jgi:hypothetical protein
MYLYFQWRRIWIMIINYNDFNIFFKQLLLMWIKTEPLLLQILTSATGTPTNAAVFCTFYICIFHIVLQCQSHSATAWLEFISCCQNHSPITCEVTGIFLYCFPLYQPNYCRVVTVAKLSSVGINNTAKIWFRIHIRIWHKYFVARWPDVGNQLHNNANKLTRHCIGT